MAAKNDSGAIRELTLTRVYDAPRELVFRMWTDPRHVARWWGPKGFTNVMRNWEAQAGREIDLTMRAPDGNAHPMGGVFREVVPPERLVFTSTALVDETGRAGLENLNTVTFAVLGDRTKVTVHVVVLRASEAAAGPLAGMEQGWSQSLDRLGELVLNSATNAKERAMRANPYLLFNGNCEAAFKFYAEALGASIESMMTHAGTPAEANTPPAWREKILHAVLRIGDTVIMASDAPPDRYQPPQGFSVALAVDGVADADRIFHALSQNGSVRMPLQETFFAARFGMLVDRFGISWMVNCDRAAA